MPPGSLVLIDARMCTPPTTPAVPPLPPLPSFLPCSTPEVSRLPPPPCHAPHCRAPSGNQFSTCRSPLSLG